FLDVDELDEATMPSYRRIDGGINQLLHSGREICAHGITSLGVDQITTVLDFPLRANWPCVGSAQQNHGSVSLGGRGRSAASRAAAARATAAPAAAFASAL